MWLTKVKDVGGSTKEEVLDQHDLNTSHCATLNISPVTAVVQHSYHR